MNPLKGKVTGLLALSLKLTVCGQCVYPSANPHMLLTVSGITFTVFKASVDYPLSAYEVTGEINKGSNDV